jgi:uridine phosphorylase
MTDYPAIPDKYLDPALVSASELISSQLGSFKGLVKPEGALLLFSKTLPIKSNRKHLLKQIKTPFADLYIVIDPHSRIVIANNFGMGAPATAVILELLAAFGVKQVISIGLAGALQAELNEGDLVVCEHAIRDEGTSYHYLAPAQTVSADLDLTACLSQAITSNGITFTSGTSWTTDAPFRETRREVDTFQRDGVKTVEMEAAGLFAVAQHLGVHAASAFVISDSLADGMHKISRNNRLIQDNLEILAESAVSALKIAGSRP